MAKTFTSQAQEFEFWARKKFRTFPAALVGAHKAPKRCRPVVRFTAGLAFKDGSRFIVRRDPEIGMYAEITTP